MRRLFASLLLLLLCGVAAAGGVRVELSAAAGGDVSKQVSRIIVGILSYARWPTPPETYRFCMAAEPHYMPDAQSRLEQAMAHPVSVRRLTSQDAQWPAECDVLYIGQGGSAVQRQQMLKEAIGKPVLTISEGDDVCVDPSMFCLAARDNEIDLLANLDAISRSTVRINPRVLQLLHRRQDGK